MLALFFDARHLVVMVRVAGVLSSQHIESHDREILPVLAREAPNGEVRGIYDLSAVEFVAVPTSRAIQRGQAPSIMATRVVVAPPATREFVRIVCEQQRLAGHREPIVVATLEEAYLALGLVDPHFEAVEAG